MEHDRALIATGIVGAIAAALCCATPLLIIAFGTAALTAWFANTGYIVVPALLICVGLLAFALTRKRRAQR